VSSSSPAASHTPATHFVGAGALLHQAVDYSLRAGLPVTSVLSPPGDSTIGRLRARGVTVLESVDPNEDLPRLLGAGAKALVFSINNARIIRDDLLTGGALFFNIHNGLVQDYRGIAEVCIFAALCAGDTRYGVTLQRLLPGQEVDSGPVLAQVEFPIGPEDRFHQVLKTSLEVCRDIFESQVRDIAANLSPARVVSTSKVVLRYRDVSSLAAGVDPERLARACDLGRYRGLLPRLASAIESAA
jgi:methionyl-tRNA formyltransferase